MEVKEELKIKLLKKMGALLKGSSFKKDEPIPIYSIFFNNQTGEIYEPIFHNENTLGVEPRYKYLKHGETIAVRSRKFDDKDNLSVFITIPPCVNCYKELVLQKNLQSIH